MFLLFLVCQYRCGEIFAFFDIKIIVLFISIPMEDYYFQDPVYSKIMGYIVDGPVPQAWKQPFYFKEGSSSLVQRLSGPCGLFAVLQAHIIQKQMYTRFLPFILSKFPFT